jgi:hypothetical protein
MLQIVVEELLCLVIGADATQCCHDPGIMMHPAKLVQPPKTQAFSKQTVRAQGVY